MLIYTKLNKVLPLIGSTLLSSHYDKVHIIV